MMKWQEKLTKAELKHLRESGPVTLRALRVNRAYQKMMKEQSGGHVEPCYECKKIAQKLGLE
jgi:hypothetical protein